MVTKSLHRSVDLVNSVEKSLVSNQLIQGKDRILLSISGGQDSICLLVILNQLCAQMEFYLGLIWCHHLWQIDSFSLMRQITKISYLFQLNCCFAVTPKPISSELLARNWRYNCSSRICFFYNYYKITLAHSANDKAETMLLNLMRGTGVAGLSPLPWEKKKAENCDKKTEHVSQCFLFPISFFFWSPFFLHQKNTKKTTGFAFFNDVVEKKRSAETFINKTNIENQLERTIFINQPSWHIKKVEKHFRKIEKCSTFLEILDYLQQIYFVVPEIELKKEVSWVVEKVKLKKKKNILKKNNLRIIHNKKWFYFVSYTFLKSCSISFTSSIDFINDKSFYQITRSPTLLIKKLVNTISKKSGLNCLSYDLELLSKESNLNLFDISLSSLKNPWTSLSNRILIKILDINLQRSIKFITKLKYYLHYLIYKMEDKWYARWQWHSSSEENLFFKSIILLKLIKKVVKKKLDTNWQVSNKCKETELDIALNAQNCSIIRPLLSLNRFDISKLCLFWQLPVYPDQSNQKLSFLRNRIRKQLLPVIKLFFNSRIEKVLLQFSEIFSAEEFYMTQITTKFFKKFSITNINGVDNQVQPQFVVYYSFLPVIKRDNLLVFIKEVANLQSLKTFLYPLIPLTFFFKMGSSTILSEKLISDSTVSLINVIDYHTSFITTPKGGGYHSMIRQTLWPMKTVFCLSVPLEATFWVWNRKLCESQTLKKHLKGKKKGAFLSTYKQTFNFNNSFLINSGKKKDTPIIYQNIVKSNSCQKKGKSPFFTHNLIRKFNKLELKKKEIYWPFIISFLPKALQRRFAKIFLVNQSWDQIQYSQIEQFLTIVKKYSL